MAGYRDLLQQVKCEIDELDAPTAAALDGPGWLDVRELHEWQEGHIPGAVHIARGSLESNVENAFPDRERPIVVYCSAGNRSAFAAKTLGELGYDVVYSLAGGYTDWKRNGFPTVLPRSLDEQKRTRYSRHLLIPEVGEEGQLQLLDSRILLIGASVWHGIPIVHGSIFRFEGQITVFKPNEGPCYRCLFPQPPPAELAPSCAEGGVLGVLPGIVGSLQANEAIKLALGIGDPLVGRLVLFDALEPSFHEISLKRDPARPV